MRGQQMLHNRVCRSHALLPLSIATAAGLWCLGPGTWTQRGIGFALLCAAVMLTRELSNRHGLIRVYSRSVSSLLAVAFSCLGFLHTWQSAAVALCTVLTMLVILGMDEPTSRRANALTGSMFHAMFCWGAATLLVPQLAALAPLMMVLAFVMAQRFTMRMLCAGLLGFAMPAAVLAAWFIWRLGDWDVRELIDSAIVRLDLVYSSTRLLVYSDISSTRLLVYSSTLTLLLLCGGNNHMNRIQDKVRVRGIFTLLRVAAWGVVALGALMPQAAEGLMPALLALTLPMVAHCLTLSRRWPAAALFWLLLLAMAAAATFTLTEITLPI